MGAFVTFHTSSREIMGLNPTSHVSNSMHMPLEKDGDTVVDSWTHPLTFNCSSKLWGGFSLDLTCSNNDFHSILFSLRDMDNKLSLSHSHTQTHKQIQHRSQSMVYKGICTEHCSYFHLLDASNINCSRYVGSVLILKF